MGDSIRSPVNARIGSVECVVDGVEDAGNDAGAVDVIDGGPDIGREREACARRLKAELVEQRARKSVGSHESGETVAFSVLLTRCERPREEAASRDLGE